MICPGLVKSYIYASNDIRPESLKREAKPVDAGNVKRLAEIHEFGMEPDVIAARVLEAMRENRFHIFTHPEFKDELSELFAEVLQDFRDYPHDPGFEQRTGFEKTRRESYKKQRRGSERVRLRLFPGGDLRSRTMCVARWCARIVVPPLAPCLVHMRSRRA